MYSATAIACTRIIPQRRNDGQTLFRGGGGISEDNFDTGIIICFVKVDYMET